jgi:iron complex outermembrane receptor protein
VEGVRALTAESGTRTATPIERIPQSVQVLTGALLREQGSVTLEDALVNAPSVQAPNALNFNQTLTTRVRGFRADILRDGLATFFDAGAAQSLLGVERIEIVKGPSGALFGGGYGGGLGGVINIVSALPLSENRVVSGVRLGSYSFLNPTLDVNRAVQVGPLEVMGRVQAEYIGNGGFLQGFRENSYNIIPAVTLRRDQTSLTVQGVFSRRTATEYPGLPVEVALNRSSFAGSRFFNPSNPEAPASVTERNGVTLLFEHRFNDAWRVRFTGRYSASNLEEAGQALFSTATPGLAVYPRANFYLTQDLTQLSLLPMVEGRFTTGPARHHVLAGFDFDRVTDQGSVGFGFAAPFRLAAPDRVAYVRPPPGLTQVDNTYTTVAGFVQNQVTLWDRLHFVGGLRVANLEIDSRTPAGVGFTSSTTRVLPRVGVGYEVVRGVTPFVGWGQGMRGDPYVRLPVGTPRPELSEQVEAGVKLNLPGGLTGTLALFQINRENVAVADPSVLFAQRQTGEQRSRGFDAELLWQPNRHLSVLGAYAYTETEVIRDTVLARGTAVGYVPRHAGRIWASYRMLDSGPAWLRGVTVSGGLNAAAGAPVGEGGPRTKGYVTFDAQVSWENGPLRVALTARNLTDRRYFVPYEYFGGAVAPAAPMLVFASAALRF